MKILNDTLNAKRILYAGINLLGTLIAGKPISGHL